MGRFEWDVRLAALVAGTFRIVFRRARVSRSDTIPVFSRILLSLQKIMSAMLRIAMSLRT